MKRVGCFLVCAWLTGVAFAEERGLFPARFDVIGVDAADVLNIRRGPGTEHAIIGALGPQARDIEVVGLGPRGKWAHIATGEGGGWVSARHLRRQGDVGGGQLPYPLVCTGAEPFWALEFGDDGRAFFSAPDIPGEFFMPNWAGSAEGLPPQEFALVLQGKGSRATAMISRTECSDGMSDRPYGLAIRLLIGLDGNRRFFMGCCRLEPRPG